MTIKNYWYFLQKTKNQYISKFILALSQKQVSLKLC